MFRRVVTPLTSFARLAAQPSPHVFTVPRLHSTNTHVPPLKFRVLNFYVIAPIGNIEHEMNCHRQVLVSMNMFGRVYVCADGINAQVSGVIESCDSYEDFVTSRFPSQQIIFKRDLAPEHAFPTLKVKAKRLVPFDADLGQRGISLSPVQWKQKLDDIAAGADNTVVLDVRNSYEWDLGRFEFTHRPPVLEFKHSDIETFPELSNADKKKTDVMMYCTGGIRCEYFSVLVKKFGFQNVYMLEGGVQNYGAVVGSHRWQGKLFVFDRRNSIPVGSDPTPVVGVCHHCQSPTEAIHNCCNIDCNALHLSCTHCWTQFRGCCCAECTKANRVRPIELFQNSQSPLGWEQGPPPGFADINRKRFLHSSGK